MSRESRTVGIEDGTSGGGSLIRSTLYLRTGMAGGILVEGMKLVRNWDDVGVHLG